MQMGPVAIVFLDVETTIPTKKGQKFELLEFGAVVVSVKGLVELDSYSTFVQPSSLSAISSRSVGCNGITKKDVADAPLFSEIAGKIYELLDGQVWAGHNILRFDIPRIREAFAEVGQSAPEPVQVIDTLPLLKSTFGNRAGNMKMDSLASYCGLGEQVHRSIGDARMNFQILRSCATLLFLEAKFPAIFTGASLAMPGVSSSGQLFSKPRSASSSHVLLEDPQTTVSLSDLCLSDNAIHSAVMAQDSVTNMASMQSLINEFMNSNQDTIPVDFSESKDVFDHHALSERLEEVVKVMGSELGDAINGCGWDLEGNGCGPIEQEDSCFVKSLDRGSDGGDAPCQVFQSVSSSTTSTSEEWVAARSCILHGCKSSWSATIAETRMLERTLLSSSEDRNRGHACLSPKEVRACLLNVEEGPSSWGQQIPIVLYDGLPLRLYEPSATMRYSVSETYAFDKMGKPTFNVVIEPSQEICSLLLTLETLVHSKYAAMGGHSLWRPTTIWREGGVHAIRLRIGTTGTGESACYTTRFSHKNAAGTRSLGLDAVDPVVFRSKVPSGCRVDVVCGLDVYDFQGGAGFRLVAHDLTICQ